MRFKPSYHIPSLKDEYDELFFNPEESQLLIDNKIFAIFQVFQDENGKPDPDAKRVQRLLSGITIGINSRVYRLELLRNSCDPDPTSYQPRTHTPTVGHNKIANTLSPSGDGYLPRRARGELSATATDVFDGSRTTRQVFDNHHRGGGYDNDDFGGWNFD